MFNENPEEEKYSEGLLRFSPAILTWQDLSITAKQSGKKILKPMNGRITGGFWAIMGPNGCGKTSFLNALSYRFNKKTVIRGGECRLNGRKYNSHELKAMSCYVMAVDVLNAYLTVYETLLFTAQLRLPRGTTDEEIEKRVNEVISILELTRAKNTIVGNSMLKGISGGEKRRLCIAMELLTYPKLLFLDEPTTGLDSVTALIVCKKLKDLGDSGKCTVVCTIHQPQSKIFDLIDFLILLKEGNIVYQGASNAALGFFEKAGFICPSLTNPADFLLDIISPPVSNIIESHKMIDSAKMSELESKASKGENFKEIDLISQRNSLKEKEDFEKHLNQNKIIKKESNLTTYIPENMDYMNKINVDLEMGKDKPFLSTRNQISWCLQYYILTKKNLKEYRRKIKTLITQLINIIVMAVFMGTVFYHIGDDQISVQKRSSSLFFCCVNQGLFVALEVLNSFPAERELSLRERKAGTYNVSAYFMAKMTSDFCILINKPFIFTVIVYFLIGYDNQVSKFFVFLGFMLLCNMAAVSMTLMITALCRTAQFSVIILPLSLELVRMFGGFFLSPALLPKYFSWIDALSFVKYSYIGISLNELTGLEIVCTPGQLKNGVCPITNGEETIQSLGLDYITKEQAAGFLLLFIIVTRMIAYLGLRFLK